jgi:predicted TIM-barrel fold metal-dependent hydrolase
MEPLTENPSSVIDMHCHVGLLGDEYPDWGCMPDWFKDQLVYQVFLLYAGLDPDNVSDSKLREKTGELIDETEDVDGVVCLALDPVFDENGIRHPERSPMWVSNDYILALQQDLGNKVLLGASVHPYDPNFQDRVSQYVDLGAVLLKWLPSAQQFDLADERVRDAIVFLAKIRDGEPLPLLLHVGPEYALESWDPRTSSFDFLSWTWWDRARNRLRGSDRWHEPRLQLVHENLRAGLQEGSVIIFAHCGLPYYAPKWLPRFLEHSELPGVERYLREYPVDGSAGGRCYTDVSACATPFRRTYYDALRKLPPESLLFGSDFPTPVFELTADAGEMMDDFQAMLRGDLKRIVVPQDNLLEVNYRELEHYFPGHPMFTNFSTLL